jgi:hypothetical protein
MIPLLEVAGIKVMVSPETGSFLAGRAEIGVPSGNHHPANGLSAAGAALTGGPVGDQPVCRIVVKIGSTVDSCIEDVHDRGGKERQPDQVQVMQGTEGPDAGLEEDLISVDIADPGDPVLVQQEHFHPLVRPCCTGEEALPGNGQGIRAESSRSNECFPIGGPSEPPEPPGIGEGEAGTVSKEDRGAGIRGIGVIARDQEEIPGHSKVEHQRRPGIEIDEEELPVAGCGGDYLAGKQGETLRVNGRYYAGDPGNGSVEHRPVKIPADGLDFGELGHKRFLCYLAGKLKKDGKSVINVHESYK